jgi:multiple sugar transport system permease protein
MSDSTYIKDVPPEILYKKRRNKIKPGRIIGMILVILIGIIMIYPLIWMLMSSFKPTGQILITINQLWPSPWTFDNYIEGWQGFARTTFTTFFINSFKIAGIGTIGMVLSSSLVAYSFSRGKYKARKFLFAIMLGTLMLPGAVMMVPSFMWGREIDNIFAGVSWFSWMNTHNPLIVPAFFGGAFFIFLITNFTNGIPRELDEAAKIDGCSFYGIYKKIVFPLSVPALITATIFSFLWRWDDFMGPLIFLRNVGDFPVSLALRGFTDSQTAATPFGPIFAMSVLSLVPLVAIFFLCQRYLVEGISTTGLKG